MCNCAGQQEAGHLPRPSAPFLPHCRASGGHRALPTFVIRSIGCRQYTYVLFMLRSTCLAKLRTERVVGSTQPSFDGSAPHRRHRDMLSSTACNGQQQCHHLSSPKLNFTASEAELPCTARWPSHAPLCLHCRWCRKRWCRSSSPRASLKRLPTTAASRHSRCVLALLPDAYHVCRSSKSHRRSDVSIWLIQLSANDAPCFLE